MFGIIYALAEPDSGNVRYCGKTIKRVSHRVSEHRANVRKQSHRHLYRWLQKVYDANKEPTVMVCEEINLEGLERAEQLRLLNEAEQRWISQFKALGFKLTNATNGGDGCHGRVPSEESRRKASRSNTGKKRSAEVCANVKRAAQERPQSCYLRGENHPHRGKTQHWKDPEARAAKLRAGNNPNASLTEAQAIAIYLDDNGYYKEIAVRHATTEKVVGDIKTGKSWSSVTKHDAAKYTRRRPGRRPNLTINVSDGIQGVITWQASQRVWPPHSKPNFSRLDIALTEP